MAAVYAHLQPQEELAALFSRNLTLNPLAQPAPAPAPEPAPVQTVQERKIVYVSQHYTHSAHLAKQDTQPPRPASEPPQSDRAMVERVLREHSVDPSGLSSAQLELFKTVDTPQQLRLIELWRACPPPARGADNPVLAWGTPTTVDQEEALARARFERQQQELVDQQLRGEEADDPSGGSMDRGEPGETVMSLDGTPLTPVQAGDGRWVVALASAPYYHYMEPYMASGYEEMARREYEESVRRAYAEAVAPPIKETTTATTAGTLGPAAARPGAAGAMPTFNPSHADPVYRTTNVGMDANVDWGREAAMADQYGRAMAMREDEEML